MKIAIIGSGISGLSTAWLLNKNGHDISVFEQNSYIGGHSNTVQIEGHPPIDTGFIVFNNQTYPNLIALFDLLGVESTQTDMSFGVSLDQGRLEYSSHAMFGQKKNLVNPKFYKMLSDILQFYKHAPDIIEADTDLSLGAYLEQNRYSTYFIDNHILPMGAAIWSMSKEDMFDYPVQTFVRFFVNHGLLQVKNRPKWRSVHGGSREYVSKLTADFKDKIMLNCKIDTIKRNNDHIVINNQKFNHVILATHSDQALSLLSDPSTEETDVLSNIPYSTNTAYLHTDERLMPKNKKCWSSWNYLSSQNGQVELSYWMNTLQQHIENNKNYFVTLNPLIPPRDETILYQTTYHHPVYVASSVKAQKRIKRLQGYKNTWYCGAWCGYGFHEDGLTSGLYVAEKLANIKRPWGNVEEKSVSAVNTI